MASDGKGMYADACHTFQNIFRNKLEKFVSHDFTLMHCFAFPIKHTKARQTLCITVITLNKYYIYFVRLLINMVGILDAFLFLNPITLKLFSNLCETIIFFFSATINITLVEV